MGMHRHLWKFFSRGKCVKNKLWLPSLTWISVHQLLHFSRGEYSCAHTGKQHRRTKPSPCKSSRASWQTWGPKTTQNTLRIGGNNYKETSTNYQWPSLICTAPFLGNTHFRMLSKNILKLSYFSANPHTFKDSVKHRYCQSHIHKSHITIQHLKYKLYICKQISSLKQLAALILDGNSVFLFTEHQQRSQSCL